MGQVSGVSSQEQGLWLSEIFLRAAT